MTVVTGLGWDTHHSAVIVLGPLAVDEVVKLWRDAEDTVDADYRVDYVVSEDRELYGTNVLWTESNTHTYTCTHTNIDKHSVVGEDVMH